MTAERILKKPINKPSINPLCFMELKITFKIHNKDKIPPPKNT